MKRHSFPTPPCAALASAWQLSGIVRIQSGTYFAVTSGFDTALTAAIGNNRANQILGRSLFRGEERGSVAEPSGIFAAGKRRVG